MMNGPDFYMALALDEAKKSGTDLPIACVIADSCGNILAKCHNEVEISNDVVAHAEILAIKKAEKKINSKRLADCKIYVTLEPCPMCAYAILNAKILQVYFGAHDKLYGAFGGKINMAEILKSKISIMGGIKEEECEKILKDYFKRLRDEKNS